MGLGLNYLTASFNGYDPVAFLRLIPPLPQSTSHYFDVHCTVSLIYYRLNGQATINSFASKSICTNNTDTLACMWKTKWYKCKKKIRDIRLYKSSVQKRNTTLIWFTDVSFSNFFYVDNIGNYWMASFKSCCSLIFLQSETEIQQNNHFASNKTLLSNIWTHWPPFSAPIFRWRRTFVVWNLRVYWFMRLENHLHFLKFYKLSLRRCT